MSVRLKGGLRVCREWVLGYIKEVGDKDIGTYAASTTFFLFLSLIPIVMLVSFVIPYFGMDEENMIRWATDLAPDFIDGLIAQIIREANRKAGGIVPVTLAVILWSVAKSIVALMKGLQLVYEVDKPQQVIFVRLRAILYVLILLILLVVTFGVVLFGRYLKDWVDENLPYIPTGLRVLYYGRHAFIVAIMVAFLVFVYTIISEVRGNFRKQIPGALVATVMWYVYTYLFSYYASTVHDYSALYGSLAVFVVLFLWLYSCIYILFLGGSINHYRAVFRESLDAA